MKTKRALGTVALAVVSLAVLAPLLPVVSFAVLGIVALAVPLLVLLVPLALVGLLAYAFSPARADLPAAPTAAHLRAPMPSASRTA
jgi:cbb3-type cytochrome oxidase subunit 3